MSIARERVTWNLTRASSRSTIEPMCYAAMVEHDLDKLSRHFRVKIDESSFLELFRERTAASHRIIDGEKSVRKVSVAKGLELHFLRDPLTATAREIEREIGRWRTLESARMNREIETQALRVKSAETALHKKATKKAENDLRIGSNKIRKAQADLKDLTRASPTGDDGWIWPKYHFPGIVSDRQPVIRPFRYLIRPRGQSADFDDKYSGAYNAQQERLQEVFFWRELLGRHHGFMQVRRFRERKDEAAPHGKHLRILAPPKTREEFEFDPGYPFTVPFLWDHWTDPAQKEADLFSAAAITCDPSDEIKRLGIRRLLTPLSDENLGAWSQASRHDLSRYSKILADYSWDGLRYAEVA